MTNKPIDLDKMRALADAAHRETLEPGWPYDGSGDWSSNVDALLGGATGTFCAAMSPKVVTSLISELREARATIDEANAKWTELHRRLSEIGIDGGKS